MNVGSAAQINVDYSRSEVPRGHRAGRLGDLRDHRTEMVAGIVGELRVITDIFQQMARYQHCMGSKGANRKRFLQKH